MDALFLPVLSHFQNQNTWTASVGRLRYKVVPGGEALTAEVWEGPWCYELSEVEDQRGFPCSEEGLEALRAWVLEWSGTVNARPKRTLAEDLARRKEPRPSQDT